MMELLFLVFVIPNVAKAGGLQSQGDKGAAVVVYCKPLATPDMKSSGFPPRHKIRGKKDGLK
jgi:hypothetical protein